MTKTKRLIIGASFFVASLMTAVVMSASTPTVARATILCPDIGCHTGFCDYEPHRTALCSGGSCYDMTCAGW